MHYASERATFDVWKRQHPEKWAMIEGTLTSGQLRTLRFLDAQIHLERHIREGVVLNETIEVKWLRRCVFIYLYVMRYGLLPTDLVSQTWMKNQRRGSLCEYQIGALQRIPGWKWAPRRSSWDERAEHLNQFREEYGRDPRVRSGWDIERGLAHWYQRQRQAARERRLTPHQIAALEGDNSVPTGEIHVKIDNFAGSYASWFQEFWTKTVPSFDLAMLN